MKNKFADIDKLIFNDNNNHSNEIVHKTMTEMAQKQESIILEQLGELVTKGFLVVESTQPVIVHSKEDPNKLEIRSSVRLALKDREYIQKLEEENKRLQETLSRVEMALKFSEDRNDRMRKVFIEEYE